jgi:hypothetical protein
MSHPQHAHVEVDRTASRWAAPGALDRIGRSALMVGVAGVVLLAVTWFFWPDRFFQSYLIGHLFWLGIALGSLALVMVQHLSGGAWGLAARRVLEAASRTIPAMAVLFVPVIVGMGSLYVWMDPEIVAGSALMQHKASYLDDNWWIGRAVLYFAIWIGLAYFVNRWSARQDEAPDVRWTKKLKTISAPGLVLYVFSISFAAMDWIMSMEPEWFSTIYGAWLLGGHGISALAFLIVVAAWLAKREPMTAAYKKVHFHDWGKLMLAFTLLWSYFSLSQLLIIWSGNLPEEVVWYEHRLTGGWQYVAIALALLHFAAPFLLLLSRDLKRDTKRLVPVALLLLVMHWVDYFWNVMPSPRAGAHGAHGLEAVGLSFGLADPLAVIGLGGLWVWLFVRELRKRPLLPVGDPYLEEVFHEGH